LPALVTAFDAVVAAPETALPALVPELSTTPAAGGLVPLS
jgi:hypothetical protein